MSHRQLLLKPLSKEKDLSEFQPFGTKVRLWKMKKPQNGSFYAARYLPALKALVLRYKSPWEKSSTVRVSKHCTLSLKSQPLVSLSISVLPKRHVYVSIITALIWRYSALSLDTSMHNSWWRQTKYNSNIALEHKTWFINFQKAVQGDGSGKKKLKSSNIFRQLLTAVTAFVLED